MNKQEPYIIRMQGCWDGLKHGSKYGRPEGKMGGSKDGLSLMMNRNEPSLNE